MLIDDRADVVLADQPPGRQELRGRALHLRPGFKGIGVLDAISAAFEQKTVRGYCIGASRSLTYSSSG